jgi:hypothetical protein
MRLEELQKVGIFAMETIERIGSGYDSEATIDNVAIVVAIRTEDDDGRKITSVRYGCTDERGYVQRGLFEEATDAARFGDREPEDEEDL